LVWRDNAAGVERYPIRIQLNFDAYPPHCGISANDPGNIPVGGTHGIGGTLNMTTWGTGDDTDIAHEVGHMLGAPDNYGKVVFPSDATQSQDWPKGRAQHLGIMNNPSEDTVPRNYWLIKAEFPGLMQKLGFQGTVVDVEVGRQ
jgi:hypothetical protein